MDSHSPAVDRSRSQVGDEGGGLVTTVHWLTGDLTPLQQARVRMLENREWLDDNIADVQRDYANKWVAVLDRQICASADQYPEVLEAIGDRLEEAVFLRVPGGEIARPI